MHGASKEVFTSKKAKLSLIRFPRVYAKCFAESVMNHTHSLPRKETVHGVPKKIFTSKIKIRMSYFHIFPPVFKIPPADNTILK